MSQNGIHLPGTWYTGRACGAKRSLRSAALSTSDLPGTGTVGGVAQ
jgi:hypothetical protein